MNKISEKERFYQANLSRTDMSPWCMKMWESFISSSNNPGDNFT